MKNLAQDYYGSAYSVWAVDIDEVVIEDVLLKDGIRVPVCSSLMITIRQERRLNLRG